MPTTLATQVKRLRAQAKKYRLTLKEYEHLFNLQRTRMAEATKLWQKATGNHHIWPDLGELLEWLLSGKRGKK